jgi:hypothetical protein
VHTARPIGTLEELITVASDIDVRVRQRRAERDRKRKCSGIVTGITATPARAPFLNAPFVSPASEPAAMDVDTTCTRDEFLLKMRGRCFGCGSGTHARKDGNHDRDLCAYCKRVGHRETVCMDKFMGKPKGQKAAATVEREDGELSPNEPFEESEEEEAAATTTVMLAWLVEQQKALADQIAALHEEDF